MLQEIKEAIGLIFKILFIGASIVAIAILFAQEASASPAIKSLIAHEAAMNDLDPAVALAVAEVESNFNPKATGKQGEVGLFQLHPKFHRSPSYDVNKNIRDGVKTLIYWQRVCPQKANNTYVNCYNAGKRFFRSPHTAPYFRKFNRAYQKYKTPSLAVAE